MKKIQIIITGLIILSFFACQKYDNPVVTTASTYPISGEWWVNYKINGKDSLLLGWNRLLTSNTAANISTEILITGKTRLFDFTFKSTSDIGQKTFSVSNSPNLAAISKQYFNNFTVQNGKVIVNGTHSITNVVTDSIYFELLVDDPTKLGLAAGTKLIVSGKRRTGFPADDY